MIPGERNRAIMIAIRATKRTEQLFPLPGAVKLVGVIECVSGLMPEIHHDLAGVFEIIGFFLQLREFSLGQLARNADNRLSRRASPLVGKVDRGTKPLQVFPLQFAVQLLDEGLKR